MALLSEIGMQGGRFLRQPKKISQEPVIVLGKENNASDSRGGDNRTAQGNKETHVRNTWKVEPTLREKIRRAAWSFVCFVSFC